MRASPADHADQPKPSGEPRPAARDAPGDQADEGADDGAAAREAAQIVHAALDRLSAGLSGPIAAAVSGGSDSAGMLLALARRAAKTGLPFRVVTVDHQLRAESAAEAVEVGRLAAALGAPHTVLRWSSGGGGEGGGAAAAREARYALMADWARAEGVSAIAVAHTRDDVAETLLLRLARGSGVDGLSEMAERAEILAEDGETVALLRPCLDVSRSALRALCRTEGVAWIEDPSNDDPRYDRTLARGARDALAPRGLDRSGLAATARRLRRARTALEEAPAALIARAASVCPRMGWARLDGLALASAPRELGLRALARLIEWTAGAPYPPRAEALEAVFDMIRDGGRGRTLHGVAVHPAPDGAWRLCREAASVAPPIRVFQEPAAAWDRRWRVEVARLDTRVLHGPLAEVAIGAIGEEGLAQLKARADRGARDAPDGAPIWTPDPLFAAAPRRARLATPGLWSGGRLVSAPLCGLHPERLSARLIATDPTAPRAFARPRAPEFGA